MLLIPALGGPERKVAEVFTVVDLPSPFLAWSPDGKSLVISGRESTTGPCALFLLSVESGERQRFSPPRSPSVIARPPSPQTDILWPSAEASTSVSAIFIFLLLLTDPCQPEVRND